MASDGLHTIVSADGTAVVVRDLGGPDDREAPVLLFSHATGFHGEVWRPLATELIGEYRCLAIDHRGHGLSAIPEDADLVWSSMGEDVAAVLDSELVGAGRVVHGIGHSMGGAALVLGADSRPGRFRSLWLYEPVIVAPGVLPPPGTPNPMADGAARRRSSFESFDAALVNFAQKPPLDQLRADALRAYVEAGFAPQPDGSVVLRCSPTREASVYRGAPDSGAWSVVGHLTIPIAMVSGRQESFGPVAFMPAVVEILQRGTVREHPELGHFGPLENPTTMAHDVRSWVESLT
ncbi:MAG TPA: alpha/beta hydrolase [Acidimicrobiales bacterium]|jgi:pimeloyl-ACP methyl ester carboxylesterase|nr:alpha/beta hydrolase [Acidimicrobiales bacterium]